MHLRSINAVLIRRQDTYTLLSSFVRRSWAKTWDADENAAVTATANITMLQLGNGPEKAMIITLSLPFPRLRDRQLNKAQTAPSVKRDDVLEDGAEHAELAPRTHEYKYSCRRRRDGIDEGIGDRFCAGDDPDGQELGAWYSCGRHHD